jgi:hypothetical protein
MLVEIRLTLFVELRRVIDAIVISATAIGVINPATDAVAAIVAIVGMVITGRVVSVTRVTSYSRNQSPKYGSPDNRSNVMPTVIVSARIGIERISSTMVIAGHIREYPSASLRYPYVFRPRIITPSAIEDTWSAGNLMNKLRPTEWSGPAFAILVVARMAFNSCLSLCG